MLLVPTSLQLILSQQLQGAYVLMHSRTTLLVAFSHFHHDVHFTFCLILNDDRTKAAQLTRAPTIPEGSGDRRVGRAIQPHNENRPPFRHCEHFYF
jgi:hypothetical protein